ncbi:thiamine pyrophosphate-dependent enzyme [Streptomyces sp. NPDC018693]|uniref:thiamine pyrophosphate-dependent enzyme n=1 Tax=unclassified Streptomyces TaxID=2593676 RepID=UPI00379F4E5F
MPLVAEVVRQRLLAWEIERVFGRPGEGADPLVEALRRGGDRPELVQPRHGEAAAFMAGAHAEFTGGIGCCLAPSGPGAVQLLSGLYDARLDRRPVLALVGGAPSTQRVFLDAAEHCEVLTRPDQAARVVDRALWAARSRRGVAVVVLPTDLQDMDTAEAPGAVPAVMRHRLGPPADADELRRAARLLNEADRVALVVGPDARDAREEVVRAAELLGAGVAKTLPGRDVVADDMPFVTGCLGRYATPAAERLLHTCDAALVVGAGVTRDVWLPAGARPRCVEIAEDSAELPEGEYLFGDARATLRQLLPHLTHKADRAWRADVETRVSAWHEERRGEARQHFGHLINPAAVAVELDERLPERAVLTADAGTSTVWWARGLRLRHGMRALVSGTYAAMGTAVPYALAARLAHPDRPVIAFVGDGALQMSGLAELVTVKDLLPRLAGGPPLVFCVFHNQDLNQATWDRRAATGNPRLPSAASVPAVPYAEYARLLGLEGIRCERPGKIGESWDAALAADRPVVLEFLVDAEIQPPAAEPRPGKGLFGGRRR